MATPFDFLNTPGEQASRLAPGCGVCGGAPCRCAGKTLLLGEAVKAMAEVRCENCSDGFCSSCDRVSNACSCSDAHDREGSEGFFAPRNSTGFLEAVLHGRPLRKHGRQNRRYDGHEDHSQMRAVLGEEAPPATGLSGMQVFKVDYSLFKPAGGKWEKKNFNVNAPDYKAAQTKAEGDLRKMHNAPGEKWKVEGIRAQGGSR